MNTVTRFLLNCYTWVNNIISNAYPSDNARTHEGTKKYPIKIIEKFDFLQEKAAHYHYPSFYKPEWIDIFEKGFQVPAIAAIELKEGYLIGKGLMLDKHKRIILESAFFQKEYIRKLRVAPLLLKLWFVQPKQKISQVIVLSNRLSNNYYHWTIENLVRILYFLEQNPHASTQYKIAINADAPKYVLESLMLVAKWPEKQIISIEEKASYAIENAILITYPAVRDITTKFYYGYPASIYQKLNSVAFAKIASTIEDQYSSCFIISRNKAAFRRILNEQHLIDSIPSVQIQSVILENYSLGQQIKLFQQAKVIFAPHGAGLTNLVYCRKDVLVIEFFPRNRDINQTSCFHQITKALGIVHHLIMLPEQNEFEDLMIDASTINEINTILLKHHTK